MVKHIDMEMMVVKEEILCSQIPRNRRHSTLYKGAPQGSTRFGQEVEGMRRKGGKSLNCGFQGKEWERQGQLV